MKAFALRACALLLGGTLLCAGCAQKPAPGVSPSPSTVPVFPGPTLSAAAPFTPAPSPTPSATASPSPAPSPSPIVSVSPRPTGSPSPTPTAVPAQLGEKAVLSLLKIQQADLIALKYYDVSGDGVKDAIVLYANPTGDSYTLSAVNSATKKHADISFAFGGLERGSAGLTLVPVKSAGKTTLYAIAGGQYGGSGGLVGYSVAKYKDGWTDIFKKYRDTGMTYTLSMEDGPRAVLKLENGQRYTLIPTDIATYRASGWIDEDGRLTSSAQVFAEHTGFSSLTFAAESGKLTAKGVQEIRGLHKLDVLAKLETVWSYNGSAWTIQAKITPVASKIEK